MLLSLRPAHNIVSCSPPSTLQDAILEGWITESLDLIRAEWRKNYKPIPVGGPDAQVSPATSKAPSRPGPGRRSAQAGGLAVHIHYSSIMSRLLLTQKKGDTRAILDTLSQREGDREF